ncbi:hypothetical protein [Arthrobacter bambusae]|uniref:hypothetical protein n=1 Tax=Arthrobacter bambusae TaxID=1338426 RepID=UPI00278105E4|nr:hypothetical protein [Arthrobacter bambusae]MDQ0239190.1 hypothetical protein [Arthrobacter bambusae]
MFALLGGAVGAACINWGFGVWKLKVDRTEEHDRWLRNEKVEAYSAYIDASLVAYNKVPLVQPKDVEGHARVLEDANQLPLSRVLLVASEDVREASRAAAHALSDFAQDSLRFDDNDPERTRMMDEHGEAFIVKVRALQELCRQDLGVQKTRKN